MTDHAPGPRRNGPGLRLSRSKPAPDHAELRFRHAIEHVPAVIYTWDPTAPAGEAAPLYLSPQLERLLGYHPDEWIGDPTSWLRVVHPDDRARIEAASDASDRAAAPFREEYRVIARDGRIVWVRDESEVVERDADGRATLAQGVMFDITAQKEAERSQREAEARYRELIHNLPVVAYVASAASGQDHRFAYVSPGAGEMTGYPAARWLSERGLWESVIHADDRERVLEHSLDADRTGEPFDIEYRLVCGDDRTIWVHDTSVLVEGGADGELTWQGLFQDVTARREAEERLREAEERYRALVEQLPVAVYTDAVDEVSSAIYISPQYETLTGYSAAQRVADPELWTRMLHAEDRERVVAESLRTNETGYDFDIEYRLVRADGRVVWVHDHAVLEEGHDGAPVWQGVLTDITERKLAEQALRESEQRERDAAERLRALDDMKNTFLAAVSHELRSPLTSILGLSLTLERSETIADSDRRDLLVRLAANARKLDRLLKDLLDIDRLNRGIVEPQLRTTDVGALARAAVEALEGLAGRSVTIEVGSVVLPVDPAKVERIVENLVTNAVRHTESGRQIWLLVEPWGGGALVTVEDDGPGISPELREAIFEPFRQGPTASAHAPGTGIGLSLVARFAELHGGRAWVEDRNGGGSSFHVFLPGPESSTPRVRTAPVQDEDEERVSRSA